MMLSLSSALLMASGGSSSAIPDITYTWVGYAGLAIFIISYYFRVKMQKYKNIYDCYLF